MRIGSSGNNISLSNLKVANVVEEKTDADLEKTDKTVKPDSDESSKIAAKAKPVSFSHGLDRINLIARSFVHQDKEGDEDNYSLRNLKASQKNDSMMAKYNLIINGIIDYRLDRTETLIDSGMAPADAKELAGIEALELSKDVHKKAVDEVNEDHLEKEAKEAKEDIETRTEEVVNKKQEEKQTEAKETKAKEVEANTDINNDEAKSTDVKVTENISEDGKTAQGVQSAVEAGAGEPIAAGSVGVEAGTSVSKDSAPVASADRSGRVVIGEKVDVLV